MEQLTEGLKRLFGPKAIAVVGASRTPGKPGTNLIQNLLNSKFPGIYPVNPKADNILGVKSYPSLEDIPNVVDLAIIVVPPKLVAEEVKKCGKKGIPFAVIISSGFAEEGRADLQEELVKTARAVNVHLLGPNTTGIINSHNGLIATLELMPPMRKGVVSVLSQTGMFGGFLLAKLLTQEKFGISKVVGLGNKCDLTEADFLDYLAQDSTTQVIVCYIEGVDTHNLEQVARRVSAQKPIIVVRADKSEEGKRAMLMHTGSMQGSAEEFSKLCKETGLIRAATFDEMFDLLRAFSFSPLPKSNRVGIISNTGGGFVTAIDHFQENQLQLATLSEETVSKIKTLSPEWHRIGNPVDMVAIYMQNDMNLSYETAVEAVLQDPNVDAVLLTVGIVSPPIPSKLSVFKRSKLTKPVLLITIGNENFLSEIKSEAQYLPIYDDSVKAVRALSALHRYADWKTRNLHNTLESETDYNDQIRKK